MFVFAAAVDYFVGYSAHPHYPTCLTQLRTPHHEYHRHHSRRGYVRTDATNASNWTSERFFWTGPGSLAGRCLPFNHTKQRLLLLLLPLRLSLSFSTMSTRIGGDRVRWGSMGILGSLAWKPFGVAKVCASSGFGRSVFTGVCSTAANCCRSLGALIFALLVVVVVVVVIIMVEVDVKHLNNQAHAVSMDIAIFCSGPEMIRTGLLVLIATIHFVVSTCPKYWVLPATCMYTNYCYLHIVHQVY